MPAAEASGALQSAEPEFVAAVEVPADEAVSDATVDTTLTEATRVEASTIGIDDAHDPGAVVADASTEEASDPSSSFADEEVS